MVDLPVVPIPLKTLWLGMPLFLHTLTRVESIKEAGAVANTTGLEDQYHGHQVTLHNLRKAIVGDLTRKVVLHVHIYTEDIKMLEGPKAAQLENDRYGNYLALG